jgi:hypothetical protein
LAGNSLGNATIASDSTEVLGLTQTQAAGFYAVEYNWADERVISYRGTNAGSVTELAAVKGTP